MYDCNYLPTSHRFYASLSEEQQREHNEEQSTIWHDHYDSTTGWTKKYIYKDESPSLPINNNEQDIYIKQLEEKIAKQQELICKQEQTIKQLTNTYSEFVTMLTRLWNKSFNIDIIKTREEIKEILKIWYEKEWLDVL